MRPSTSGLPYSAVTVARRRSGRRSSRPQRAARSGWAPSLETDSIRSSSYSCCQVRVSRGAGCACHGRCRSASGPPSSSGIASATKKIVVSVQSWPVGLALVVGSRRERSDRQREREDDDVQRDDQTAHGKTSVEGGTEPTMPCGRLDSTWTAPAPGPSWPLPTCSATSRFRRLRPPHRGRDHAGARVRADAAGARRRALALARRRRAAGARGRLRGRRRRPLAGRVGGGIPAA